MFSQPVDQPHLVQLSVVLPDTDRSYEEFTDMGTLLYKYFRNFKIIKYT
jgi:hypothetical protein